MSAQKTYHIPAFDHVFDSFHLVISVFIIIYLILNYLCISGEKGGIWKLCGDLKKEIGGELSLNVTMLQRHDVLMSQRPNVTMLRLYDVQPLSTNVMTFQSRNVEKLRRHRDSSNENFLDIKNKNNENKR